MKADGTLTGGTAKFSTQRHSATKPQPKTAEPDETAEALRRTQRKARKKKQEKNFTSRISRMTRRKRGTKKSPRKNQFRHG
jgi:hypothetical protein